MILFSVPMCLLLDVINIVDVLRRAGFHKSDVDIDDVLMKRVTCARVDRFDFRQARPELIYYSHSMVPTWFDARRCRPTARLQA